MNIRDLVAQSLATLALKALESAMKRPKVAQRVREILPERLKLDEAMADDGRPH